MIIINIAGFLTDFTEGRSRIELQNPAATVEDAFDELWQLHPGLRDRVLNERGQLRQHVNVFLDNENIRRKDQLLTALPETTEITILPAVSGGQ